MRHVWPRSPIILSFYFYFRCCKDLIVIFPLVIIYPFPPDILLSYWNNSIIARQHGEILQRTFCLTYDISSRHTVRALHCACSVDGGEKRQKRSLSWAFPSTHREIFSCTSRLAVLRCEIFHELRDLLNFFVLNSAQVSDPFVCCTVSSSIVDTNCHELPVRRCKQVELSRVFVMKIWVEMENLLSSSSADVMKRQTVTSWQNL